MPRKPQDKELTRRWIEAIENLVSIGAVQNRVELASKVTGLNSQIIANITSGRNGVTQDLARATYEAFPQYINKEGLLSGLGDLMLIRKKIPESNIADQLRILAELFKDKMLTKQEFEKAKDRILT